MTSRSEPDIDTRGLVISFEDKDGSTTSGELFSKLITLAEGMGWGWSQFGPRAKVMRSFAASQAHIDAEDTAEMLAEFRARRDEADRG